MLFVSAYRGYWVTPLPPVPRRFRRTAMVFRRYGPPCFVRKTGSSSRELRSPPECFLFSPARLAPGTFREVSSLFATSTPGVHYPTSIPSSSAFHPQSFAPSRWFAPPSTLRACFIPLPRPGFALQGFPPPGQPKDLLGPSFPLAVGADSLLVGDHQRQSSSRRPQGVSGPGSAASTGGLVPSSARIPSCDCAPSGSASKILAAR